jgi:N-acylneuraminate cytidylyltransferase
MLLWTIEAAQRAHLLDRVVVSTEDPEIAAVTRASGCEVLPRPQELAGDDTTTLEVLQHIVSLIPCHTVVLLQPTSPIRSEGLIDACVERFRTTGCHSLATGFICKYQEYGTGRNLPRQKLPGFFYDDGNVYVIRADLIRSGDRFGKKQERFIISREENFEIDDEFDLWMVEQVLVKCWSSLGISPTSQKASEK